MLRNTVAVTRRVAHCRVISRLGHNKLIHATFTSNVSRSPRVPCRAVAIETAGKRAQSTVATQRIQETQETQATPRSDSQSLGTNIVWHTS